MEFKNEKEKEKDKERKKEKDNEKGKSPPKNHRTYSSTDRKHKFQY